MLARYAAKEERHHFRVDGIVRPPILVLVLTKLQIAVNINHSSDEISCIGE